LPKSVFDYSQNTDREILMHVLPRLDNIEDEIERQDARSDKLESSIVSLRQDLTETEARLSQRVDERFDKVDEHLNEQDDRLDRIVETKRKWPDGAVIVVTAVVSFLAYMAVNGVTHVLHL
jgi:septal ring factor EnvC (AmiA/AmiB activator)